MHVRICRIHRHQHSEGIHAGLLKEIRAGYKESCGFQSVREYILGCPALPLYHIVNLCFHVRHLDIRFDSIIAKECSNLIVPHFMKIY